MAQADAAGREGVPAVASMREERRIVTALFADIAGSTAIGERLDPEDARDLLGGAVALVIEQVDALGGTVKDLAGDGVLALFGAPIAHEDDAERAVLCGLKAAAAVADYAHEVAERWGIAGFCVRVGIETGPAVVGPVGAGSRVEYGAVGDALNTAARLQAQADPGVVLVGPVTRGMVPDRFEWGAPESRRLKGKDEPVTAAAALAHVPRHPVSVEALRAPIVGRREDLARLEGAFAELRASRACVVLLEGEAGVGKSRLLHELGDRFRAEFGDRWLEGAAVSYGAAIPYVPYRNLLLGWLGLPLDASASAVQTAIAAGGVERAPGIQSALADLRPLLTGWSNWQPADPQAAQAVVFGAMRDLVTCLAHEGPIAVALEDLHWSDATSLALTEALAAACASVPLLLLLSMRPDPASAAAAERVAAAPIRAIRVDLKPLSRESDRELLHALVGGHVLPRLLEERLLDTTDGNPFFMEEQVRALVDQGALVRTDGALRYRGSAGLQPPPTVERALMARIDRLGERERGALLAASVLGQRFDAAMLAELMDGDPRESLAVLQSHQFVQAAGDTDAYRFRHALVQEAAYRSLLRRQRRELHARAAAAIEAHFVGQADEVAVTLGRHLAESGESRRAVGYLLVGARRAAAAFANDEAASLCDQALSLLAPNLADIEAGDRPVALELLELRTSALRFLARYGEAAAALQSAIALTPADDALALARLHVEAAGVLADDHRYEMAIAELDVAEACVGERVDDDDGFAVWLAVQLGRGNVFYWRGDVPSYSAMIASVEPKVRARATRAQQIRFFDAVRSQLWRRDRYVISDELLRLDRNLYEAQCDSDDPEARAWAPFLHGFTLLWHRDLNEAQPLLREALAHAEELDDALLRSRALTYLMVASRLCGDVDAASALVEPVREAAREAGLPEYEAMAAATAAWAAWRRGDRQSAESAGREAIQTWEALPNRYFLDWMACLPLAAVALLEGDPAAALRWASLVLADSQQPLPECVATHLRAARDAAQGHREAEVSERLEAALGAARKEGYL